MRTPVGRARPPPFTVEFSPAAWRHFGGVERASYERVVAAAARLARAAAAPDADERGLGEGARPTLTLGALRVRCEVRTAQQLVVVLAVESGLGRAP